MKKIITLLLCAVISTSFAQAKKPKYPIYDNQRLPRPEGLQTISSDDLQVKSERLEQLPQDYIYADKTALTKLGEYFRDNPDGQAYWSALANNAAQVVNQWDFNRVGFGAQRYIYCLGQLPTLSLVYLYSGQPLLGRFIHDHVMQVIDLPMEFWLHAELRGYNLKKPAGALETASLSSALAQCLSAAADIFTPDELKTVRAALQKKGLQSTLNWLDRPRANNWTAVIGAGTYTTARYLGDRKAQETALERMRFYLEQTIEADGSYGEGNAYFNYPVNTLFPAFACMDQTDRDRVFKGVSLRYSPEWLAYSYLYNREGDKIIANRINFSDCGSEGAPGVQAMLIQALAYDSGLAIWEGEVFRNEKWLDNDWRALLLKFSGMKPLPKPQSPAEAKLPLVRTFDNGNSFIRSSWECDDIVLGMSTAGPTKTKYAHQHPERNSIALGAYGEYLIVGTGSASYRSPVHRNWDLSVVSKNTIQIDDNNQLFGKQNPNAEVTLCKAGKNIDIVVGEAARAYSPAMKHMTRCVAYARAKRYFVVIDFVESAGTLHNYTWRLLFNNRDGKAKFHEENHTNFLLERPKANLAFFVDASAPFSTRTEPGRMHGPRRDYSPGGPGEGKPGSGISFAMTNTNKTAVLTCYSVLQPLRPGERPLPVGRDGDTVKVGEDTFQFTNGVLTATVGGQTEEFTVLP